MERKLQHPFFRPVLLRAVAAAFVAAAAVLALDCLDSDRKEAITCSSSDGCPAGFVCRKHFCLSIYDSTNICRIDAECPVGFFCGAGFCMEGAPDGDADSAADTEQTEIDDAATDESPADEPDAGDYDAYAINCDDGQACTTDSQVGMTCSHKPAPDGTTCGGGSDENGKCLAGICVKANGSEACCGAFCEDCSKLALKNGAFKCAGENCEPKCSIGFVLVSGVCQSLDCDDANPCTYDGFNQSGDACKFAPIEDGTSCFSENGECVFKGTCRSGACENPKLAGCDDGVSCTKDDCDPAEGCAHTPDDSLCGEGQRCNPNEGCETPSEE